MSEHRLTPRLILAPLRGFTDAVFRTTYAEHFAGFDGAVAPFVAALPAGRLTEKHVRDLLPPRNGRMPVEPQILGNGADDFIFLARHLFDMGYPDVNWNLGCPFRPVTKKRRGSGLLPFPEQVDEFLGKVTPALPGGLSIKMRLGRTTADEIFRLLPVLNRYPLREITIHPRTARQMYTGQPDLATFKACLDHIRHPVTYNGDITDLAGFQELSARFPQIGCWMIGRGALSNPFLPAEIKGGAHGADGKGERFRAFYADLFGRYREILSGPGHLMGRMKGFWTYFAVNFRNGEMTGKQIHRAHQLSRYLDIVERFFAEGAEWVEKAPAKPLDGMAGAS
jgi:tRNA-dihydrouridine synthase